jgi:hypothetical protein
VVSQKGEKRNEFNIVWVIRSSTKVTYLRFVQEIRKDKSGGGVVEEIKRNNGGT